jgi:hypothetical protein|tara:strand:- start:978 stop:1286 length:309 start_codon:yes stop_codon:yes gene_type:complete
MKDYILGMLSLVIFVALWKLFGFWWAFGGIFVYYTAISFWHIWQNPEMILMWDSFTASKYDKKYDDKWYAKVIRNTIGVPIYWFVDKLEQKAKRKEEAGEYE